MKLFETQETTIREIKYSKIEKEKYIQTYFEKNMSSIIDANFIATEFTVEKGRIDSLAIDNDFNPVIIEYKKGKIEKGLLQALFYKRWLQKNRKFFRLVVKEWLSKKDNKFNGQKLTDERIKEKLFNISFNNTRVILVAEEFDEWTKASTSYMENIELLKYAIFDNMKYVQFVNENEKYERKSVNQYLSKPNKFPSTAEADYEVAEYVWTNKDPKAITTLGIYRNQSTEEIKRLYLEIIQMISEIEPKYQIIKNKDYWVFKTNMKFFELYFQTNSIKVQLFLYKKDIDQIDIPVKSLKDVGHWGTLLSQIDIKSEKDLPELKKAIEFSIINVNNINSRH